MADLRDVHEAVLDLDRAVRGLDAGPTKTTFEAKLECLVSLLGADRYNELPVVLARDRAGV